MCLFSRLDLVFEMLLSKVFFSQQFSQCRQVHTFEGNVQNWTKDCRISLWVMQEIIDSASHHNFGTLTGHLSYYTNEKNCTNFCLLDSCCSTNYFPEASKIVKFATQNLNPKLFPYNVSVKYSVRPSHSIWFGFLYWVFPSCGLDCTVGFCPLVVWIALLGFALLWFGLLCWVLPSCGFNGGYSALWCQHRYFVKCLIWVNLLSYIVLALTLL